MAMDSNDNRGEVSSNQPQNSLVAHAPQNKQSTKKRKSMPPGWGTVAARDARRIVRIKKDNPYLTEEEIMKKAQQIKSNYKKNPPHHCRKDVFIERQKRVLLKKDPNLSPTTLQEAATERYNIYQKGQIAKTKARREKFKKIKEAVKSVDKELASMMRVNVLNTKEAWIARRVKKVQRENKNISPTDAQQLAQSHYLEKLEKDKWARRIRNAKLRLAKDGSGSQSATH